MNNIKVTYDLQYKRDDKWVSLKLDRDTIEEARAARELLEDEVDYYSGIESRIMKRTVIEEVVGENHLVEYCAERGCPCGGKEGMCVRCGQETGELSEFCPGPRKDK